MTAVSWTLDLSLLFNCRGILFAAGKNHSRLLERNDVLLYGKDGHWLEKRKQKKSEAALV